jgi:hypothetical protein
MQEILIAPFSDADQQGVLDVILPIQQREFGIPITAADQPDLTDIPEFYQSGTGGFWVARSNGEVVGTVGLKDIGSGQAALRKMFVAARFRGRELGVAGKLTCCWRTPARKKLPRSFSAPRIDSWRRIASTKSGISGSCQKPVCPRLFRSWPSIRNSMSCACREALSQLSIFNAAMNASCGMSTLPNCGIFLPSLLLQKLAFARGVGLRRCRWVWRAPHRSRVLR